MEKMNKNYKDKPDEDQYECPVSGEYMTKEDCDSTLSAIGGDGCGIKRTCKAYNKK